MLCLLYQTIMLIEPPSRLVFKVVFINQHEMEEGHDRNISYRFVRLFNFRSVCLDEFDRIAEQPVNEDLQSGATEYRVLGKRKILRESETGSETSQCLNNNLGSSDLTIKRSEPS